MTYLNDEILKGFNSYQYSSKDTSPLSIYIMHPFWDHIVNYVPPWIAPNLMTFIGFLLTVLNFIIIAYYDWDFYAQTYENPQIPQWVWLFAAINNFAAYMLDGIDGKQARRIKLSGPLGEFFDHALDSYTGCFIPICLYSVFGRGATISQDPIQFYYIVLNVTTTFYISHWEKYNTGILYLPWSYDPAMWSSTLMYASTYVLGPNIWKHQFTSNGLTCAHLLEYMLHITNFLNIPMVAYNLYKSYIDKTGKMRIFGECIRPLISLIMIAFIMTIWVHVSPSDIINNHPRAVYLLTGTIISNAACRLIVSQMSNTRSEAINWMIPYLSAAFCVAYCIPNVENIVLYMLLVFSTVSHWHYGIVVIQQLCEHFGRKCFKVTTCAVKTD